MPTVHVYAFLRILRDYTLTGFPVLTDRRPGDPVFAASDPFRPKLVPDSAVRAAWTGSAADLSRAIREAEVRGLVDARPQEGWAVPAHRLADGRELRVIHRRGGGLVEFALEADGETLGGYVGADDEPVVDVGYGLTPAGAALLDAEGGESVKPKPAAKRSRQPLAGLTPRQAKVLALRHAYPGETLEQLAERLDPDNPTSRQNVRNLLASAEAVERRLAPRSVGRHRMTDRVE